MNKPIIENVFTQAVSEYDFVTSRAEHNYQELATVTADHLNDYFNYTFQLFNIPLFTMSVTFILSLKPIYFINPLCVTLYIEAILSVTRKE